MPGFLQPDEAAPTQSAKDRHMTCLSSLEGKVN
ncbi:conserved hypothetical protein [Brucella melitensis M5-90]|uniref:Uncharacterized protein n=1 Tax=Brucella suis (strain ATCC 23445 / NCTC 10510) TaxID=470137 RepID=A9WWT5_BRUSI|nr:Hypothetical protein, conserved [Brucella suis ATCC 23445]ADZ87747.1 conserved hypothetical protein [Brucella melitensis M5-90]